MCFLIIIRRVNKDAEKKDTWLVVAGLRDNPCACVVGEPVSTKREGMEIMTEMEADADKNTNRPRVKEAARII